MRPVAGPPSPAAPIPVVGVQPTPGPAVRSTPPDLDSIPLTSPFAAQRPPRAERPAAQQDTSADIPVVTGVPVSRMTQQPPGYFTRPTTYVGNGNGNGNGPAAYGNGNRNSYGNGNGNSYGNGNTPHGTSSSGYNTGNSAYTSGNSTYGVDDGGDGINGPVYGNDGNTVVATGGGNNGSTGNYDSAGDEGGDTNGLPKRVRQASLAPQLRSSRAAGGKGSAPVPPAAPPNPADVRNTFAAMQQGWKQGRSQQNRDPEGK
jgi:hypothetical protein